jgi:hypothetical protein
MAVMCSLGLILYLIRILVGKPAFVIDVCVVYGSPAARTWAELKTEFGRFVPNPLSVLPNCSCDFAVQSATLSIK